MRINIKTRGSSAEVKRYLNELNKRLKKASGFEVDVGYPMGEEGLSFPNPHYDGEVSIIEVAIRNNYGLGVPKRAFMDHATEDMRKTYLRIMATLGEKLVEGTASIEKVLDVAGLEAEEDIRNSIENGPWKANALETVKRKKSSKPLKDTGSLINRPTHRVRRAK